MAKSLLSVKSKPKAARKTKSETYLVNRKYYGDDEPVKLRSNVDVIRAFNWYHAMKDVDDARGYLKQYFKDDKTVLRMIDKIPDKMIPYTSAWLCRMADNIKAKLESDVYSKVIKDIENASNIKLDDDTVEKPKVEKPNIQERIRERASDIIGDVEALIDSGEKFSLYEWLQANEVPAMHAKRIADYYIAVETEMRLALIPKGQDGYVDGYENWTKADIRKRAEFYMQLRSDAERFAGNVKKARAPRKKKAVTKDKLLKLFTYMKESNEHKLVSINPESIIGAQTLWTFNTRNNVLSVFNASNRTGLSINRTAIAEYDPAQSKAMKIGRKTEERLQTVLKGGKVVIRRLIEEMNLEVTDRINNHTILLKTVR
jgi:hypothetical protein